MDIKIVKDVAFLRQKSEPITSVVEAQELFETLKAGLLMQDGYGLAAIQIGIPKQIAVVKGNDGVVFPIINPTIIDAEDEFDFEGEGCLSFPGVFVKSKRFEHFIIQNWVIDGNHFRPEVQCFYYDKTSERGKIYNLEAIVCQHEMDHFSGLTILDYGIEQYGTIRKSPKIGRNDNCPCNSGKKYKKCCLGKAGYV